MPKTRRRRRPRSAHSVRAASCIVILGDVIDGIGPKGDCGVHELDGLVPRVAAEAERAEV